MMLQRGTSKTKTARRRRLRLKAAIKSDQRNKTVEKWGEGSVTGERNPLNRKRGQRDRKEGKRESEGIRGWRKPRRLGTRTCRRKEDAKEAGGRGSSTLFWILHPVVETWCSSPPISRELQCYERGSLPASRMNLNRIHERELRIICRLLPLPRRYHYENHRFPSLPLGKLRRRFLAE